MAIKVDFQGLELAMPAPRDDIKAYVQFDDGEWLLWTVDQLRQLGAFGKRVKVVVAPMSRHQLYGAIPALEGRVAHDCAFLWGHPIAVESSTVPPVPAPRDDYHDVTIVAGGLATTYAPGDEFPGFTGSRIESIEASAEFYDSPVFKRLLLRCKPDAKFITRPRPGAHLDPLVSPRKTTIEVPIPSGDEFAAKCEKLAEPAQRVADAIKSTPLKTVKAEHVTISIEGNPVKFTSDGLFDTTAPHRISFTATAAPPKPDGAPVKCVPGTDFSEGPDVITFTPNNVGVIEPFALRHARATVEDLRKKLDDARRELRYQRAIAPAGTKRIEGFVSAVKGRETSRHVAMHVYFDGKRARGVVEAHSGAEGFIIVWEDGNPDARHMKTGIVHVFEFTGSPSALPDNLEFAP